MVNQKVFGRIVALISAVVPVCAATSQLKPDAVSAVQGQNLSNVAY
jgi:hypothetical protein